MYGMVSKESERKGSGDSYGGGSGSKGCVSRGNERLKEWM